MEDRFQTVVSAELLVNSVEMVPKSWQGNSQLLCDLPGIFRVGKKLQNPLLLPRKRFDGSDPGSGVSY